ncbi:MAG: SDR family NAD(P)-dependent oxidoreductase, partial [Sphingobium sp.]
MVKRGIMSISGRSTAGSTVFITGAGSGMGRATAELFAADGAHVVVTDIDGQAADAVAQSISAGGGSVLALGMDVADQEEIAAAVAAAVARFGGIDILINNAGVGGYYAVDDDGYEEYWDRMISINLTGQQRIVRAVLPHIRRSKTGRIVIIASTEALGVARYDTAYSAAKGGVVSFTRALAVDLGREG